MQVVIAGSSGFLGTALRDFLMDHGHDVVRLVRREPAADDESRWDPYRNEVDQDVINGADVVVNLAGSPTAGNPHSKKWARNLRESRVTTTRVLADAVARSSTAGAPTAFLAGNAIAIYGDHGDEIVTEETDSRGDSLLTQVTRDWLAATDTAIEAGARVCILHTTPVMDRRSEPLKQLRPLFRAGLGARLGDGQQFFPMISLRDWVGAVAFLAENADSSGRYNLACPVAPTNAEFTHALADALGHKARLVVPAFALRVAAGPMAPEVLGSVRAEPAALVADGYRFQDDDARDVIAAGLAS